MQHFLFNNNSNEEFMHATPYNLCVVTSVTHVNKVLLVVYLSYMNCYIFFLV